MEQSKIKQLYNNDKLKLALDLYSQKPQNAKALWTMHYYYEQGLLGAIVDFRKCINCLKTAASQGHAGASYKLVNYFLIQDDSSSVELIHAYTNEEHIQKCIDKTEEYNDPPYYDQQEYINLLKGLKEQIQRQNNPIVSPNAVLIKRKNVRYISPSLF